MAEKKEDFESIRQIYTVLVLHFIDEMKQSEIAAALNLSTSKVNRLITQGRRLGMVKIAIESPFQRLGDLAAGTVVVHRDHRRPHAALPDAPPRVPDAPLGVEDQLAIIEFTQRHAQLSPARQEELADILAAHTGVHGAAAVSRLRGIGNWLVGSR